MTISRSPAARYAVAFASLAVATLLRDLLDPIIGDHIPYGFFLFSVGISARYGGRGPGLLATGLGFLVANWFFVPPYGLSVARTGDVIALTVFVLLSLGLVHFAESLRAERARAVEEKERFETTLSSIGDGVIVTDARGRILSVNPIAESVTGWRSEEARGEPLLRVFSIISETSRQPVEDPVARVLQSGSIVGLGNNTLLIRKDGQEIAIDDSAAPIRDEEGNLVGVVLVFRDVTERRRAEAELERSRRWLERVAAATPDILFVNDIREQTNLYTNRQVRESLGYTPEELSNLGKEVLAKLVHPEDLKAVRRFYRDFDEAEEGEVRDVEARFLRADGEYRWLQTRGVLFSRSADGKAKEVLGLARDVTGRKRMEEELRANEERFRVALLNSPVMVFNQDEELRYTWGHHAHPDFPSESILGKTDEELYPREPAMKLTTLKKRVLETGEGAREELEILLGGKWLTFDFTVEPLRDTSGRTRGVTTAAIEVTERKRNEQATQFLADAGEELALLVDYKSTLQKVVRLAIPSLADWCVVDVAVEDGELKRIAAVHRDPGLEALVGKLPRRSLLDSQTSSVMLRVFRSGKSELVAEIPESLLREYVRNEEELALVRALAPSSFICVPIAHRGRSLGVMGFVRSDPLRPYDALDLALAEELARRSGVALDNARLYDELREADRKKDEFLAMLAHELRNPLAAIRHGAELLKLSDSTQHAGWATEVIERQSHQLKRLVDDLLDVSRISRGKIELKTERMVLTPIVDQAVSAVEELMRERELTVSIPETPVMLEADPARIEQILVNLLANAAKYTGKGGTVSLSVIREGEEIVIRVKDSGIGMTPEELRSVFDPFAQSREALASAGEGLGLGLTLVKRLAEMHGGSASAASEGRGKGSELVVRLPRASETAVHSAPEESSPQRSGEPRRVLVVDDNRDLANSTAMLLESAGHEVHTAYDGPEAIEAARRYRPEVILLDIALPGFDGYQVARRLRQDGNDRMKIVAVTGFGQKGDRSRSLQAGFDDHLTKPVDRVTLLRAVAD